MCSSFPVKHISHYHRFWTDTSRGWSVYYEGWTRGRLLRCAQSDTCGAVPSGGVILRVSEEAVPSLAIVACAALLTFSQEQPVNPSVQVLGHRASQRKPRDTRA